ESSDRLDVVSISPTDRVAPTFLYADAAPTAAYSLSLHDALPIYGNCHFRRFGHAEFFHFGHDVDRRIAPRGVANVSLVHHVIPRSEEHTSELQSPYDLVCRLLLEKKKKTSHTDTTP